MKPSTLRTRRFERILIIKPSALGDVIHTVPVLARLRERYPSARIDWLLTPAIAELVGHHPALSNVIRFERKRYARLTRPWSAAAGLAELIQALRRPRYDLVLDLHGQFRSALLTLATGAPVRIGFDRPGSIPRSPRRLPASAYRHGWTGAREGAWIAYTHRIPVPHLDLHAVDRYLQVGPMLGLAEGPPDFHIPLPAEADAQAETLLRSRGLAGRPFAVIAPGTRWETKHWHPEGFAESARHLIARGLAVVLAGSPDEAASCQRVATACPQAVDLSGRTSVTALACLMRRAAVCLTNDSGPMHLAVALNRPIVSVFGPTDPVWIGPYGRPGGVARAGLPCSPCYLRQLARCAHGHACMKDVRPGQVIARLDEALSADAPTLRAS